MAWGCFIVFLLCIQEKPCMTEDASKLVEHSAATFLQTLQSGKTSFVYFANEVTPTIGLFLEHLKKSADALEDYGILVAKVNCSEERVPKYCTGEKVIKKVYLFRGPSVLKDFDMDTVFDVDAIVAHVLFAVLFNEVKYVQTPAELLNIERIAKGLADVVLAYVQILGLPEHRAVMEATFVYGAKYQFVLTTGGSVLKHMGVDDPSSLQSGLWFLHCKGVERSDPCHHTALKRPLTTLNIYTFLQLMEAALVTEARTDPSGVETVHRHLRTPLLFLFTQADTLAVDRSAAEALAWRLRGEAGLVLIHRDSPDVKTSKEYNAAYRLPGEDSPVKYVTLKNTEEVVNLFREQSVQDEEEDEEEEEEDWTVLDVLDDEVAESVFRERHWEPDPDLITELTADTFSGAVTGSGHTVVLFFVRWDAVSMAFMQSYMEVAEKLEDVPDVHLASVDCGEWTDVCSDEQISAFPTVRLYRPGDPPQPYRGMLGAEGLSRFIMLARLSSPALLSSEDEARSFLGGEFYRQHAHLSPVTVLGLFSSGQDPGRDVFEEAAKLLRGETMLGLFTDRLAEKWAEDYSVKLPAMLVSRGPWAQIEPRPLSVSTVEELVSHIQKSVLDSFPELTVENLPAYLELKRPLLLLFVGDEDEEQEEEEGRKLSEVAREEMRSLLAAGKLDSYLPCWIHIGRTPAGRAVLESYLGSVPRLPALVLSELDSGGEVFHYPPEQPVLAEAVLQWLRRVESKQEQPAGVISDEKWGPPVPFYDFLSIMDQEAPGYAAQKAPRLKKRGKQAEEEQDVQEEQEVKGQGGEEGGSPDGTLHNKPAQPHTGPPARHPHSEL
ncbi:thioredoxin domain-containing protein 16 [Anguilla anguilla]|uniref:thioredoxin domain-containing protein 16 n=1 Tax=Anguilla anguilla TaxID=7936 RepID=UPI0015ABBEAF|nr:thioredoxin domain-containing protein 16 [Anguilla anguilla]